MRKHKTVAEIAIEVMREEGEDNLSRCCYGVLDTIGLRATHTKIAKMHPLNRHVAVLNALEASTLFKKSYVRLDRRSRLFKLKEACRLIPFNPYLKQS